MPETDAPRPPPPAPGPRRRAFGRAVAGAAGLAVAVAAPALLATTAPIHLGQTLSLLGGRHRLALDLFTGLRVGLDRANARGGVRGAEVALRTLDDHNEPGQAAANVQQLLQDGALAIVAPIGRAITAALLPVVEAAGAALVGPVSGDATLRRPHRPQVFALRADLRAQWQVLIGHARRRGLARAALFCEASERGEAQAREFQALLAASGAPPAALLRYDSAPASLDNALRALRGSGSQFVVNDGAAPLYEALIRRLAEAAPGPAARPLVLAVDTDAPTLVRSLGAAAEGMIVARAFPAVQDTRRAIVRDYLAAMRQAEPAWAPSDAGLEGFVVAQALVSALQRSAVPSRAGLLATLGRTDQDLGGLRLRWQPGDHHGLHFADAALIGRDGRWVQ
jgi:ABC-type branched-subunit amino acid transport system substrate-binding protein